MPIELVFARQERPAGLSTLEQVRALADGVRDAATTAAAEAVTEALPRIETAISDAATDAAAQAAPAAADAIRAQVAADADRAAAGAAALPAEVNARRAIIRPASVAGYAAVVMDPAGNATWLAARDTDGAPPDWVIDHLVNRLSLPMGVATVIADLANEIADRRGIARIEPAPGLAAAVIDLSERLTWLAASASDGGMPSWVAEHVAERVAPHLSLSDASLVPSDRAVVAGGVVPMLPDMRRMAGWGSSSMEYMGTEVAAEMIGLGVVYYNGGDAGVRAEHTLAQMGARPALLTVVGGQIPASGAVTVTCSNMGPSSLIRAFGGSLAGVAGTLSSTSDTITFTRGVAGTAVSVPGEVPFIPAVGPQYRDAVTILNIGKNNITGAVGRDTEVIAFTAQAFDWLSPLVKRAVVMGHAVNRDTAVVSTTRDQIMSVNAALSARYGPLYFDLQGYMTGSQIWIDAGITPTQADRDAQAQGNKPPALSLDDLHFNNAGDAAIAKALRRFVVNLGWYKEPTA